MDKKTDKELELMINQAFQKYNNKSFDIRDSIDEFGRLAYIAGNADSYLDRIDKEFRERTKLTKMDDYFIGLAIALQWVRQWCITSFPERLGDQEAAQKVKKGAKEHTDRHHKWYNPSLEEIKTNPVPYDTTFGSPDFNLGIGGGFEHRAKTLGHDPILGWVFGTANIATSTLTTYKYQSFHVKTGKFLNGNPHDKIVNHADTGKVLAFTKNKIFDLGSEGRKKVGYSLLKEGIHLKSDMYSKEGLAIPKPILMALTMFKSNMSEDDLVDFAEELSEYGIDTGNLLNVGKQTGLSIFINWIIAVLHRLCYKLDDSQPLELYKVRTKKILSISNVIASGSNVIFVAAGTTAGCLTENRDLVKKSLREMDAGGYIVTLYRLISDTKFINSVKKEFLEKEWYKLIMDGDLNYD